MEGNTFPDFNFVELNGRKLGNETILGKIVVLKCWFIKCQQCVEEIPYLNELVNSYKKRKDIEFISFALDDKPKLKEFLVKKKFSYTIIANQKDFIEDKLNIGMYPTHILVNKDGKIVKVVNGVITDIVLYDSITC